MVGLVNDPIGKNEFLYGDEALAVIKDGTVSVGMYQSPSQIGEALRIIAAESQVRPLRVYIEVGVFSGWTCSFVTAFLWRFASGLPLRSPTTDGVGLSPPQPMIAYAVDMTNRRVSASTHEIWRALNIHYIDVSALPVVLSRLASDGRMIDVCFIDANHSYRSTRSDYERMRRVCHLCMFHDVLDWRIWATPVLDGGTPAFWAHVRANVVDKRRLRTIIGDSAIFPPTFGIGILLPNAHGVADVDTDFTHSWYSPVQNRTSKRA